MNDETNELLREIRDDQREASRRAQESLREIRDDQREAMRRTQESLNSTRQSLRIVLRVFFGIVLVAVAALGALVAFIIYKINTR